jgi:hypothetical protein
MPAPDLAPPPLNTFIIRFWQETDITPARWRGHVQHVQSGERIAFADAAALLHFLRRWVRLVETGTELAAARPEEIAPPSPQGSQQPADPEVVEWRNSRTLNS